MHLDYDISDTGFINNLQENYNVLTLEGTGYEESTKRKVITKNLNVTNTQKYNTN